MNPFRFMPRMFFTVTLLVAVPLVIERAMSADPAAKLDCDNPRTDEEKGLCNIGPNLERASKGMREAAEQFGTNRRRRG